VLALLLASSEKRNLSTREHSMPLAVSAISFAIFTALLWLGRIGEVSYCFLVAAAAMLGLVLHGFGRLQELDLKNLRLVLREIEQTKKELFVREEKLKSIAVPLAQIIALTGASEGRMGNRESWDVKREWYRQKLQALVNALELSSGEEAEIRKYMDKYAEFDRTMGEREVLATSDPDHKQVKAKLELLSAELLHMMKSDVSK
jgi:hypothetical protein